MSELTPDEIIGEAMRNAGATWEELHDEGPGRFEPSRGKERALLVALHALSMDPDEQTGDVEAPTGHVSRVERWLVFADSNGFISEVEYTTREHAQHAFRSYDRVYDEWVGEEN